MKNKSLKFKFIAAMLIGTMALASFTIGCSKKSSTSKDASSAAEADKNENSTEDITFPDESETETETDKDGNVTVKITTYETDASGETVTDSEGNKVISETKSETFTKDEWENKQKETKPSNSGNNSSKDESKQTENTTSATSKPAVAPTKPAVKPTAAPTQAPTSAASKPAEKPAVKPTAAPTKADPRKNWKTVVLKFEADPEYDVEASELNLYSNGEWYFYIKEERKNWGDSYEEQLRFYGGETGIVLYKYLGNSEKVTIPTSIDGYPVAVAACPFENNKTVKEIVIPKDLKAQFNLCYHSVITKVTVEANGKPDQPEFWHGDIFYNINNETIMVYCDEVLGNHFKEWKLKQDFAAYSYDGKTEYYRFHKIVAKK